LKQGVPAIWHNSSGQQRKLCALFMYDTREYDAQFLRAHARDSVARNVLEKPSGSCRNACGMLVQSRARDNAFHATSTLQEEAMYCFGK